MQTRTLKSFRGHLPSALFVVATGCLAAALAAVVIYGGFYNIGADAPHTKPVFWLIQNLRERSVGVRARKIKLPADLDSPARLATGAGLYGEMCSSCHLAPGMERTEISQGLYPKAPELSRGVNLTPAEEFWIIKHGVKMTAMPSWGRTHSDDLIWDMVAFIRHLPKLSPDQYQAAVKSAPEDHDAMMRDMPGMMAAPQKSAPAVSAE